MGRGFCKALQRYGSGLFRNLNFLYKFNRMFHLRLNLKKEIFLLFRIGSIINFNSIQLISTQISSLHFFSHQIFVVLIIRFLTLFPISILRNSVITPIQLYNI